MAGQFQEGQCLSSPISINPGKCYTVVAAGGPGVTEVDVEFVPNLPMPGVTAPAIAQDQGSGPTAVLGPKPDCFKNPAPFAAPMNLVLRVRAGSGPAIAQVYVK